MQIMLFACFLVLPLLFAIYAEERKHVYHGFCQRYQTCDEKELDKNYKEKDNTSKRY